MLALSDICTLIARRTTMESPEGVSKAVVSKAVNGIALAAKTETLDPAVLPQVLSTHYACLPNMLWRTDLGDFINKHPHLRQILRKASTTRSAKTSNKGFVELATAILSLEILASDFASWSVMFPEAKTMANALLRSRGSRMPLMDYYLYPPKHISPSILAALAPPPLNRHPAGPKSVGAANPELSGQNPAFNHANATQAEVQDKRASTGAALPASNYL
jgi:hypothetical protein